MLSQLETWLRAQRLAGRDGKTIAWYRQRLSRWIGALDGQPPDPEAILEFLTDLPFADVTRAGYWRAIRAFSNWAIGAGLLPPAVLHGLSPKFDQTIHRMPPTIDQAMTIIDAIAPETPQQWRDWCLFGLVFFLGLRREEARTLRADAIDLDATIITIMGKGRKQRRVPVPAPMALRLRAYAVHRAESPWLFPADTLDGPIPPDHASRHWRELQLRLRIPHPWRLHDLRHAYATHVYERTGDIYLVQQLLGHADVATTIRVYARMTPRRLRAGVAEAFGAQ